MLLGQTDGSGIGECANWVLGGFNGKLTAQRFQNQGCSLIHTKIPTLKDEICCWIYNTNTTERHRLMVVRVLSGTPVICTAMAPP